MEREKAFETLKLQPTADGEMVSDAYWRLVRKAQARAAKDAGAQAEIDRLNDAYTTLTPRGAAYAPPAAPPANAGSGVWLLDVFADWLSRQALRTRQRWAGRNPEIAMIGGGALVLVFAAIGAGASLAAVFAATAVICAAIWAPWRRVR